MSDRYPYREPKVRQALRPFPSPCLHCRYKPARRHKRWPRWAGAFCSDACRFNAQQQKKDAERRDLAERIRYHLGLPTGRGPQFTVPELEHIERRVKRLLPIGARAVGSGPRGGTRS